MINQFDNVPDHGLEDHEIGGKTYPCRRIYLDELPSDFFTSAKRYRKNVIISARQAANHGFLFTSQDKSYNSYEPGDIIIQNPKDPSEYVFGNKNDHLITRIQKFLANYEPIPGQTGKFQSTGKIESVSITENIVYQAPWGEDAVVLAGGQLSRDGRPIAAESFGDTYVPDES